MKIDINGFNSSRRITTKIVQIPFVFGSKTYLQDVICVDEIRTKFCVDGIGKLVGAFSEKGYTIADSEYDCNTSGICSNLDIVLGTDADHMLELRYCTFGSENNVNNMSSYIDSPIGVIFSGNINKKILYFVFS